MKSKLQHSAPTGASLHLYYLPPLAPHSHTKISYVTLLFPSAHTLFHVSLQKLPEASNFTLYAAVFAHLQNGDKNTT